MASQGESHGEYRLVEATTAIEITREVLATVLTGTIHSLVIASQAEVALAVEWEIQDRLRRHQLLADVLLMGPGSNDARVPAIRADGQSVVDAEDATRRDLADRYDEQVYAPQNAAREAFVAAIESIMPDVWIGDPSFNGEAPATDDPDYARVKEFDWVGATTKLVGKLI
jgi:hypothetical protein